jgi:FtsH-binding integral membrane protein
LGYDSYCMSIDEPTVPNAIFYASDIYIDIVNILIRVLDILDND